MKNVCLLYQYEKGKFLNSMNRGTQDEYFWYILSQNQNYIFQGLKSAFQIGKEN